MFTLKISENLGRHIDAGFPIIYINTYEEKKADLIIRSAANRRAILEWNGANGFIDFQTNVRCEDWNLKNTLAALKDGNELERKLLVLKDAHDIINEPEIIALLKDIARKIREGMDTAIIIVSPVLNIPRELKKFITIMEIELPAISEIKQIITEFAAEHSLLINANFLEEMSGSLKGLSEFEIENLLALSYAQDGELNKKDLSLIFEQKQQMIKKAGILDMIPLKESLDDIGGLDNLKEWLKKKAQVFKNINKALDYGVDTPKGVLIAGVPGCGKSLSAKSAAKLFDVPLLRLDMGTLLGKYVGESEANMRKAIKLAEAVSPCVLWIDELEKAFAGIGGDSGGAEVTTRLLGSFLTWMQEKESSAFVVATANDVMKLPPELLRKGRFDEIFYVSLPDEQERKKIFQIHISKRRKADTAKIDLDLLVSKTKGYSGADIEGVVKESIENVFVAGKTALTTEDIIDSIKNTHSLSEIMKEPIEKMSKIYEDRISIKDWLKCQFQEELPQLSEEECEKLSQETVDNIEDFDKNLESINEATAKGGSKENWLAEKIAAASVGVSINNYGDYLSTIDNTISMANDQMMRTVTTNSGEVSQCLNLDGFIAEQYHVNRFNVEATLKGSAFRAEVCVPESGQTYGLNSFDTVIKDVATGKIVHQYQFKYGSDAEATINLIKAGNYNNQRIVVPAEQVAEVQKSLPGKTVEAYIGGTDKVSIKSDGLTKQQAKELQLQAQQENILPANEWNTYNTKSMAIHLGKQAGLVGLQAALLTTGFDLAAKAISGQPIEADETIELALKSGADAGVKAATAGAIKIGIIIIPTSG